MYNISNSQFEIETKSFAITFQFGKHFQHFTKTYNSKERAVLVAEKYARYTNAENYWVA